ncbi:diguanylate cyclase [uncultured Paraglaciecola sp.]|uniref:diguanylate cyclase domain-containing protein n=1 Tax=uncultured Paraglaciecola sp. TaxID=1765024 RepID=UPI0025FF88DD|nr:diguanylate cyclase [uncultured Paraglaciecola sp.]
MVKISQRLYIKVALAIAFIAVAVSLFASALSYYFALETRHQANYLLAEQLSKTAEKTAVIAAYANNVELAQEIVNGLSTNQSISGARLNNNAELDALSGEHTSHSQRISTVLFHPLLDGIQVGVLDVYIDEKFVQQQTKDATQKDIFILLSFSLILAFFVSLLIRHMLTKPIQKLIDNFEHMDPHSPVTMRMLPYRGKDEIGKLVKGINALMHELHHSFNVERDLRVQTQTLESQFRLIFEQASAGICLVDDSDTITTFNPAFAAYFKENDNDELSSMHFPTLLTNTDRLHKLFREIRNKSKVEQVALDIECKVGDKQKWMHCLFAKVTDQRTTQRDTPSSIIEVILYDVTERAERELQTRFEADHDLLTHLLNRRSGEKKLHKMLFFSIKNQQPFVLMMIDLDRFKPINDTYGHDAGDKVLRETAKRIRSKFNAESDICVRWGGDEFVVAFNLNNADKEEIKEKAEKLLESLQQPIQIQQDVKCNVGASIGVVFAPEHGKVLHELLVNADNSMYKVKEQGRGHVEFYSPL